MRGFISQERVDEQKKVCETLLEQLFLGHKIEEWRKCTERINLKKGRKDQTVLYIREMYQKLKDISSLFYPNVTIGTRLDTWAGGFTDIWCDEPFFKFLRDTLTYSEFKELAYDQKTVWHVKHILEQYPDVSLEAKLLLFLNFDDIDTIIQTELFENLKKHKYE